jgi:uncharacterized Zn finger protein (UPF0148 family)
MTCIAYCTPSCGHEDKHFKMLDGDLTCPRCGKQMEVEIKDEQDEPEFRKHKGSEGQRIMEHRR